MRGIIRQMKPAAAVQGNKMTAIALCGVLKLQLLSLMKPWRERYRARAASAAAAIKRKQARQMANFLCLPWKALLMRETRRHAAKKILYGCMAEMACHVMSRVVQHGVRGNVPRVASAENVLARCRKAMKGGIERGNPAAALSRACAK